MKIAIITVATGKYYDFFIENFYTSIKKYLKFEFDLICFTDDKTPDDRIKKIFVEAPKWPYGTLLRYKHIYENRSKLDGYDFFLYFDIDMVVVDYIEKQEVVSDLVAVLHPGFYKKPKSEYTYEENPLSTAYFTGGEKYYQGCLQGGFKKDYFQLVQTLKENIDKDIEKNIIAKWWDESHLNKYFHSTPPTLVLDPNFATPSNDVTKKDYEYFNFKTSSPKVLHLEKPSALRT